MVAGRRAVKEVVHVADEGFLGRWSRRKQDARQGRLEEQPQADAQEEANPTAAPGESGPDQPVSAAPVEPARTLSLDDVAQLTRDSDYSGFVARSVSPEVRNAAMRKLFSDPHFNVMDGLDIYIDDYSRPDPLPAAMLAKLASAQFMKLVDVPETPPDPTARSATDSLSDQEHSAQAVVAPEADLISNSGQGVQTLPASPHGVNADAAVGSDVAPSRLCNELPTSAAPGASAGADHADPDLRLQPDDAAGRPAPRSGPE